MTDFSAALGQWGKLRERHPNVEPALVLDLVRAVVSARGGVLEARQAELQAEVDELSRHLAVAKAEMADLYVDEVMARQIPSASLELDAIVQHTASATDTILDSCEVVDRIAGQIAGNDGQELQDATSRIYEACSFQDVTGQRITKVMTALKTIDARLTAIGYGLTAASTPDGARALMDGAADHALMNGPQLPGQAADQSEIDRILASFT
jgi:chemotaxis protein CheZ